MSNTYSVWVGGVEVNDYLLDHETALHLEEQFHEDGYDDVEVTA
jgi:hypothetical protein